MKRCFRCMDQMGEGPVCSHCGYDHRMGQQIPYALPPGTVLQGKYLIGNVLGQGGFGITYIGFDMILEVKVAIKEYYVTSGASRIGAQNPQVYWTSDPGDMNHFITEARRMAKLDKMPEIAHVRDIFYANKTAYIVMEYVEGISLMKYLERTGLMSYEQAVQMMLPVADALGRVHAKGIVHRDISPDNLMMEPNGKLRILDLGAAGDLSRNNAQATQMVARHGFSPYEQHIPKGIIGPYTDVYAVCATIYYCCTGRVIPDAIDRMGKFMQTRKSDLDMDPRLPPAGAKVLQKGLSLEIKDRIADMDALANQLKKSLEQQKPVIPIPKPPNIPKIKIKQPGVPKPEAKNPSVPVQKPKTVEKTTEQNKKPDIRILRNKTALLAGAAVLFLVIGIAGLSAPKEKAVHKETEAAVAANPVEATTTVRAASMSEKTEKPLEITGSLKLLDVAEGDTQKITVLSGHHSREIKWSSSDPSIAKVSEDGTVTAVADGTVEMTAQYGEQTAVCSVTVELLETMPMEETDDSWMTERSDVNNPDQESKSEPFKFAVQDKGSEVYITGYNGTIPENLVIPAEIDGKPVTCINNAAFKNSSARSVTIPASVKTIAASTFYGCTALESVTISEGVTTIGYEAFKGCSNLRSVTVPKTVEGIGYFAFVGTPWMDSQKEAFVTCGDGVLLKYNGGDEVVEIPSTVKFVSDAFYHNQSIISVTVPDSVHTIGQYAFSGCTSLAKVQLPDNLQKIGPAAFQDCKSLKSVKLPVGLKTIFGESFENSGLRKIEIPETVKEIRAAAFWGCCDLTEVLLPSGIESIGMGAFNSCTSLETINLPDGLQRVGVQAFYGSGLKEIVIPKSVKIIEASTFAQCSNLSEVTLPLGLTKIQGKAFRDCTSLKNVTIPESVETIHEEAFYGCTSLQTVKLSKDCRLGTKSPSLADIVNASQGKTSDKKTVCFPETCTLTYY